MTALITPQAAPARTTVRVALVTPMFAPHVGGVELYVEKVARALRDDPAFEPVVITTKRGLGRTDETYDGYEVVRLGSPLDLRGGRMNPLWWWQLPRLLRRLRIDVVNAHAPNPGISELVTLRSGGLPVVYTYHSGTMAKGGRTDPVLRAWERWVLPRVFKRATRLVAASPVALTHATGRATVIPAGVDTRLFAPTQRERDRSILYVGRIESASRWKGVQVLVEALPHVLEKVPDATLNLVGTGDDVAAIRSLAEGLGVADRINWLGQLGQEDVAVELARAGVLAVPSLTDADAAPQVVMEALSSGTPVVGSNVGGVPINVHDGVNGFLVPPGDPSALADRLAQVLADGDLSAALANAGRAHAVARLGIQARHQDLVRILDDVAGPKVRAAAEANDPRIPTFWFATLDGHGPFDQTAGALRRRGYRVVALTLRRTDRAMRICDSLLYHRSVTVADLLAGRGGPRPDERTVDLQWTEAIGAAMPEEAIDRFPAEIARTLRSRRELINKRAVAARLSDLGVEMTPHLSAVDFSDEEAIDKLGLPLVVKAEIGSAADGVRVVRSPEELQQAVAHMDPTRASLFFQPLLRGEVRNYEAVIGADGTPLEDLVVRQFGQVGGVRPGREVVDDPALLEYGREICAALQYRGPIDIEAIEHQGRPLLIDLNPRVWQSMMSLSSVGARFDAHYLTALGIPTSASERGRMGERTAVFPADIELLLKSGQPAAAVGGLVRRSPEVIRYCGVRYLAQAVALRIAWRLTRNQSGTWAGLPVLDES